MIARRRFLRAAGTAAVAASFPGETDGSAVADEGADSEAAAAAVGESTEGESESESATIGFVGDVMLGRSVDDRWSSRNPAGVWGDLLPRLRGLDGLFVNLECCVSDRGDSWPDRTYHFRADPEWAIPALDAAGVAWASLANNHVLDYGPEALVDTTRHLGEGGVEHSGAGRTRSEAFDAASVSVPGHDVALVSLTDHPAEYAATEDRHGTAHVSMDVDDPECRRAVGAAIDDAGTDDPDLVVASVHWGPNWVTEPSERLRRFAHWLVDRGVDLVHGHSAHVIQGVEVYEGAPILHDVGDFVDDYVVEDDLHNDRSVLVEVTLAGGAVSELRYRPVEIGDSAVGRATPDAARWVRRRLRELSRPFGTGFDRDGRDLVLPVDPDD